MGPKTIVLYQGKEGLSSKKFKHAADESSYLSRPIGGLQLFLLFWGSAESAETPESDFECAIATSNVASLTRMTIETHYASCITY